MCGIAGFLHLDQQVAQPSRLEPMLDAIFHRGPDENGVLVDQELAMGMRRLSIIDLTDGKQPIFNEDGRYGVVFNGEIYNYIELRQDLEKRGHQFVTQSDTEVIVHLYEEFGTDAVLHLRGMFAFAIWDSVERQLFVARDRLGIKPLYYALVDNTLFFASEIKSLLTHAQIPRVVDLESLSHYVSLKYVPAPRTLFEGISCLLPGHQMTICNGQLKTVAYWNLSFEKAASPLQEPEAVERLGDLLRESVRIRLRSDVPFGAFLSGGVDSSVIVALMSEQLSEPVKTFSVGFADADGQDELPYARQVAERFGCEHHTFEISAQDFLNHAEQVLWHLDQPIADQATVATHCVARLAREHVKMVLTGEGGDELFAGYARYAGEQFAPLFRKIPSMMRRWLGQGSQQLPGLRRAKIALRALSYPDEAQRFANWFPMFGEEAKTQLLSGWTSPAATEQVFSNCLRDTNATTPVDRMLSCDTRMWLVDYLLLRGDKLTMANSLEARVPLLDHKLVEFAASLPDNLKLRGNQRKYLLKQFARQVLPPEIIDRKKQGFPIPIEAWLRGPAHAMMRDLLSPSTLNRRGFFNPDFVSRLIQRHERGFADHSTELWGLMSFEMWMQRFIDRSAEPNLGRSPLLQEAR